MVEIEVTEAAYAALLSLVWESIIQPVQHTPEGNVIVGSTKLRSPNEAVL